MRLQMRLALASSIQMPQVMPQVATGAQLPMQESCLELSSAARIVPVTV